MQSNLKSYDEAWVKIDDLSRGGQATTFVAKNIQDGDSIAVVKVLHSQKDMERRKRMHREATNLLTLDHPSITRVIETNSQHFDNMAFRLYLVTEYIPGPTLEQADLQNISLENAILLMEKIVAAVGYCHKLGIQHRDIKPDNIILRDEHIDDPVLIDFGLSFNSNQEDNDDVTPDGQHIGNRFLILPEQKSGEAAKRDPRSDLSQVVGLFFFILTVSAPISMVDQNNEKPHQRDYAKKVIDAIPKHQRVLLNEIFDIGFNLEIDKRFQTAASLEEWIKRLRNSQPAEEGSTEDYLRRIRDRTAGSAYTDARGRQIILAQISPIAKDVLEKLCLELGSEWKWEQRGFQLTTETVDDGMSLVNSVKSNLRTYTRLRGFFTGSELVIQIAENDIYQEFFRQAIAGAIQWQQFRDALRDHYLRVVASID